MYNKLNRDLENNLHTKIMEGMLENTPHPLLNTQLMHQCMYLIF